MSRLVRSLPACSSACAALLAMLLSAVGGLRSLGDHRWEDGCWGPGGDGAGLSLAGQTGGEPAASGAQTGPDSPGVFAARSALSARLADPVLVPLAGSAAAGLMSRSAWPAAPSATRPLPRCSGFAGARAP